MLWALTQSVSSRWTCVGVESGAEVDPFAPADGEQRPFLARFGPHMTRAGVVGGMGRIGKIHHRFAGFGLGQQRGQRVGEKGHLPGRVGLTGHGRGQFIGEAQPVQQVGQAREGVAHPARRISQSAMAR